MELAIYGARAIALGAYEAIHNLYPIRNIRCFLVTKQEENEAFTREFETPLKQKFPGQWD